MENSSEYRFIKACRGEPVDKTPVWFMRQAGRYMKVYRDLKEKHTFLELCKNPELACEVTLQPLDVLGVDAAIILPIFFFLWNRWEPVWNLQQVMGL